MISDKRFHQCDNIGRESYEKGKEKRRKKEKVPVKVKIKNNESKVLHISLRGKGGKNYACEVP